mmetsp:Transcript_129496/g.402779  ORF Transcript_129496/g.402779 Transcript_129496/m.402779 type:complete len:242 (-) Transcript_129496:13-738(-)
MGHTVENEELRALREAAALLTELDEQTERLEEVAAVGPRAPPAAADAEPEEPEEGGNELPDLRSGSSALIICEVFGGHCPPELAAASGVDVQVSLGKGKDKRRCADSQKVDPGGVSEKQKRILERLAAQGLDAATIAAALDEDVADVQRIMRKCGWNLEIPQKLSLLVSDTDLSGATHIDVDCIHKKKLLASASVPIASVLRASGMRHTEVISCKSSRHRQRIDLDCEFRMFALKPETQEY